MGVLSPKVLTKPANLQPRCVLQQYNKGLAGYWLCVSGAGQNGDRRGRVGNGSHEQRVGICWEILQSIVASGKHLLL